MNLQKFKYVRSKKARDSAKGEDCTMNSPGCNYNPETTILGHSNLAEHGKGKGIKASDEWTFYACSGCNYWFDSDNSVPKAEKERYFWPAWERTQQKFIEKGLTEVIVNKEVV